MSLHDSTLQQVRFIYVVDCGGVKSPHESTLSHYTSEWYCNYICIQCESVDPTRLVSPTKTLEWQIPVTLSPVDDTMTSNQPEAMRRLVRALPSRQTVFARLGYRDIDRVCTIYPGDPDERGDLDAMLFSRFKVQGSKFYQNP